MPPVAVEFVNTSLTSQNLDDKMGWAPRTESLAIEAALLAGMPHLRYVDLDSHGYSIVDLDRGAAPLRVVDRRRARRRVPGQALAAVDVRPARRAAPHREADAGPGRLRSRARRGRDGAVAPVAADASGRRRPPTERSVCDTRRR